MQVRKRCQRLFFAAAFVQDRDETPASKPTRVGLKKGIVI